MKLPNGERADLGIKLEDYVLNPLHREGQHKAHVFASVLGITSANAQALRNALLDAAASSDSVEPRGDNGFERSMFFDSHSPRRKARRGLTSANDLLYRLIHEYSTFFARCRCSA